MEGLGHIVSIFILGKAGVITWPSGVIKVQDPVTSALNPKVVIIRG